MAWALKDPDGFGKYWPNGDFVGWLDQLIAYAIDNREGMSAELEAQVFDEELNLVFASPMVQKFGRDSDPVVEDESPKFFETKKSHTELHSMIATSSRVLAVDEDFKQLIEQFEPGVHQFFPLTITMPKGKTFPKQYYTLVIGQFVEGYIEVEDTFYPPEDAGTGRYFSNGNNKEAYNRLQVSKDAIKNIHLWRDSRLDTPNIFISDELQTAIKEAGLTIFRHYKVKEV